MGFSGSGNSPGKARETSVDPDWAELFFENRLVMGDFLVSGLESMGKETVFSDSIDGITSYT